MRVGDYVKEPFSGYIGKICGVANDYWDRTVYYLDGIPGYFEEEDLVLIKEEELT